MEYDNDSSRRFECYGWLSNKTTMGKTNRAMIEDGDGDNGRDGGGDDDGEQKQKRNNEDAWVGSPRVVQEDEDGKQRGAM